MVLAELDEGREWRLRCEAKIDRLSTKVSGWASVLAFLAVVLPVVVYFLDRRPR